MAVTVLSGRQGATFRGLSLRRALEGQGLTKRNTRRVALSRKSRIIL